ncbi:MAG: GxxExxY protein [Candidatus Mcinerneyibacterium aminivorans]|uniref:GxxExxY protein n=1 Tax=Candidatus Mcinerneyibacterium aminivorans TaxID=2703815 RepID=A0A5D0MJL5_9BACT|nr:MAG: GxxExxY protein [Candidatus Mcinerneyibacterium aminivorans]
MKHKEITGKIIKSFYSVFNELGYGFLESVYENALIKELKNRKLKVENQKEINVFYDNELVGEFYCDLLINDKVIVEIKAVKELADIHEVQLVNYLKAAAVEVGLLVNFGKELEFKRRVFTNK